jgi:hypothetical protein
VKIGTHARQAIQRREANDLTVEQARDLLAKARTVDEAKSIRDKAKAIAVYQRSQGAAIQAQHDAAEIALWAERRMGQILGAMALDRGTAGAGRPRLGGANVEPPKSDAPKLEDLGVTKKDSFRAQRLAAVPEPELQQYVNEKRASGKPVTRSGAIALANVRPLREPEPFHILIAVGELKEAVLRVVRKHAETWPESSRRHIPEVIRDIADEVTPEC